MRMIDGDRLLRELTALSHGQVWPGWTYEGIRLLIERQPTLTPPNEWVSVDERMPGMYGNYICAVKDKNGSVWTIPAQWSLEMKMWVGAFGEIKNIVTHWMPLPAPPTKEGNQ